MRKKALAILVVLAALVAFSAPALAGWNLPDMDSVETGSGN